MSDARGLSGMSDQPYLSSSTEGACGLCGKPPADSDHGYLGTHAWRPVPGLREAAELMFRLEAMICVGCGLVMAPEEPDMLAAHRNDSPNSDDCPTLPLRRALVAATPADRDVLARRVDDEWALLQKEFTCGSFGHDRALAWHRPRIEAAVLAATPAPVREAESLDALDVERLQFVQRIHRENGGRDWWEAVSTDNPAIRVARPTFGAAIRQLERKRAALRDAPPEERE